MDALRKVVVRDDSDSSYDKTLSPSTVNLIFALLILLFCCLCLAGILYIIRRKRQAKKKALLPTHRRSSNHRRLTITTTPYSRSSDSSHVYGEKRNLMENSSSPPPSPVPEIRITFPDDEDSLGKGSNGRVVVLRIGDSGAVGMEPVSQDRLPPYHSDHADRFDSLDLDRMGGLKEKHEPQRWS